MKSIVKSSFFYSNACEQVAEKIKDAINATPNFLSSLTASSPRAVGDAIQSLVENVFEEIADPWCAEYSSSFARRAMADLAFKDTEGFHCIVDVKTHRQDTAFNMPALVSAKRLFRFYEDDTNIFSIMMVDYEVIENSVLVSKVIFHPIEFLSWDCLTIGALGWGQIQIANSKNIDIVHGQSRKSWMLSLCDKMLEFYPKQMGVIQERADKFNEVKAYWQKKPDIWV